MRGRRAPRRRRGSRAGRRRPRPRAWLALRYQKLASEMAFAPADAADAEPEAELVGERERRDALRRPRRPSPAAERVRRLVAELGAGAAGRPEAVRVGPGRHGDSLGDEVGRARIEDAVGREDAKLRGDGRGGGRRDQRQAQIATRVTSAPGARGIRVVIESHPFLEGRDWLAGGRSPGFRAGRRAFPRRGAPQWLTRVSRGRFARSQWRDRAGFAPDFPWPPAVCTSGSLFRGAAPGGAGRMPRVATEIRDLAPGSGSGEPSTRLGTRTPTGSRR